MIKPIFEYGRTVQSAFQDKLKNNIMNLAGKIEINKKELETNDACIPVQIRPGTGKNRHYYSGKFGILYGCHMEDDRHSGGFMVRLFDGYPKKCTNVGVRNLILQPATVYENATVLVLKVKGAEGV